jgi:hypothetical protein
MEDKKTLKELYERIYNNIKYKKEIYSLCDEIDNLCSVKELKIIIPHFRSQRYLHPEFMTKERNWGGGVYWWTCWEDTNPVNRKAFIEKIISTL